MIEMIMYFAGGFLVASLLAIVLISFVHQRAVRLTQRRLADAIPVSMAEIQADKDHLRAEFALSVRRLEMSVEQLKAKATVQLCHIARKTEAIMTMTLEKSGLPIAAILADSAEGIGDAEVTASRPGNLTDRIRAAAIMAKDQDRLEKSLDGLPRSN
jgi:hypothetical protein